MIHQGPDVPPPIIIMITLSIKYFIESSKLTDDTVLLQDRQRVFLENPQLHRPRKMSEHFKDCCDPTLLLDNTIVCFMVGILKMFFNQETSSLDRVETKNV